MDRSRFSAHLCAWLGVILLGAVTVSAASRWALLFPTTPINTLSRFAPTSVYDPATNSMIVFGGYVDGLTTQNDVLALSHANGLGGTPAWSTIIANGAAGSPAARYYQTAVYDEASSRMIVFGGCTLSPTFCGPGLSDVWVLVNANGLGGTPTWTQLAPSGTSPAGRIGHAAIYDAANNRMTVFGGDNVGHQTLSDVWVLTNANGLGGTPAWIQLSPAGGPPDTIDFASAVYDSVDNIMITFGGEGPGFSKDSNGVWALSHANGLGGTPVWTTIIPSGTKGSPARRDGHTAAYDAANNRMIIFGGNSTASPNGFPMFNDVWVLANASGVGGTSQWTQLKTKGIAPGRRVDSTAVYDAANNRMIIYGGASWDAYFYGATVLTNANGL